MSFLRIDWDFGLLNELIEARGEDAILERGIACPCRNGDHYASFIKKDGKPANVRRLSCPQCRGDGYIYRDSTCVKGLVTSINPGKDRKLIEMGYAVPGDLTFSPSPRGPKITDFDKMTFKFSQPVNAGQVIMRGAAQMEENATYVTDLAPEEDRLWYEADCAIWCEDENGVVYQCGTDFEFDAHKIVWRGNAPDQGTLYTVKYLAFLEWIAYNTPFDRVDRHRNLGQRVLLRKKHVAMTTDPPSDSVSDRDDAEVEFTTRTKI